MILSRPNHPWLLNVIFLILLLQGVGGAKFTIANRCTQPIWPVVFDNATQQSSQYEVLAGSSVAFQRPSGWNGLVWGKTGCIFNDSGSASCATGDPMQPATRAEFQVGSSSSNFSMDFYDVSVVNGFNLALLVDPIGGTGCEPIGCTDELRQVCPPELSFLGGAACQSPCSVFNTPEYCCTGPGRCGPTSYSQLFKKACPTAYSYPMDDDGSVFTCTHPDYFITFCPPNRSLLGMPPARPPQSYNYNPHQETRGKNRAKRKNLTMVVSVSVSGVLVLVSIAILVFFVKRRRHSQNGPNQAMENLLLQNGSLAPKRYRYSEIKKITNSLSDKLGQGGFGSVYRGMLPDGRLVAVKILSDEMDSDGEEFVNEVASISRTSHVNIVTLLGFCYEGNKRALVYEYMPNKSLDKFLGELDLKKLYEIAVGIAKGLEYLHTGCITRIVHFDIKPQNILLDGDLCPKISDFGLAKLCKKKQSVLSVLGTRGTVGYIAPEVFSRNFGGVSHKSDVYSYGMMLLEMGGARQNAGTIVIQSNSENYFPDKIYEQLLQVDVTSNLDEVMIDEEEEEERRRKMLLIGFWCIQTIPSDRPSISKVVEMLEGSLQSIEIPPKPFLFSPVVQHHETSSSSAHVETQNLHKD